MRTTFNSASFKKALATVMPAVARNSPLPILTHVRVRLDSIDGSDLQTQITAPVQAEGDPINLCLPADRLKAAVAVAGDSMVFDVDRGVCVIKCGKHRFKVPALDGREFPTIDETEPETSFESTSAMHAAIASIAFAAAVNDVRYYLNGVFLECRNGLIEATATNGHFAATTKVSEHHTEFGTLITRAGIEALSKASPGVWHVSKSMVVLESDDARIVAKSIDGRYPDWRRIMRGGNSRMTLPRAELVEAVGLSRLMRDSNKMRPMQIRTDGDVLRITTSMSGQAIDTDMPILEMQGGPKEVGINGDLLEPILKAHGDETITLMYDTDPSSSLMVENGDFRAVLMPLRI